MSSSGYENDTSSRGSFSHNWPSKNFKGQTFEAQRASQEHTKQQASVTVAQEPAPDKVNVPKFVADNLATHMQSYRSITSDPSILQMVAGYFFRI